MIALTHLLAGANQTAAALAAGVDRGTLAHWMHHDSRFAGALDEGRADLYRAGTLRLAGLLDAAIDAVAKSLDDGDLRAAIAVLRGLGILDGTRPDLSQRTVPSEMTLEEWEVRLEGASQALESAKRAGGLDAPSPGLAEPIIGKVVRY